MEGGGAAVTVVGALSRPVQEMLGSVLCVEAEAVIRRDAGVECLVLRDEQGGLGLLSRGPFLESMAGSLGYGRALSMRVTVAAAADWTALVVGADSPIDAVVTRVLERRRTTPVHHVLVLHRDGSVGHVSTDTLFRGLSTLFAARALTDGLTGLANRDMFLDRLDKACAAVNEGRCRAAVLFIDLDGFKAINDSYGHGAGDEALRVAATRLERCVRAGDLVARLGGDEFAVLVEVKRDDTAASTVRAVAGRALAELSQTMELHGAVVPGRASIGVALCAPFGADSETLLREADLAMYRAKLSGGQSVEFVDNVQAALAVSRYRPPDRERFLLAMDQNELVVHYQPIVEVATGRLASVEALVRWEHPERGLLAPADFLAGIEEAGLSVELGAYVLTRACDQLAVWRTTYGPAAPPHVNVNVSVPQLLDARLAEDVKGILSVAGVPPEAIRLEIPEVATTVHLQEAQQVLDELRAAGVAIVLDDLGAGAASLRHLTQLTLDGIKIDRQFVAGMLNDDRDLAVVHLLTQLAHVLDLTVTAEGVETSEQLEELERLAADRLCFAQGYLIGRPVAASALQLPWANGVYRRPPLPVADAFAHQEMSEAGRAPYRRD